MLFQNKLWLVFGLRNIFSLGKPCKLSLASDTQMTFAILNGSPVTKTVDVKTREGLNYPYSLLLPLFTFNYPDEPYLGPPPDTPFNLGFLCLGGESSPDMFLSWFLAFFGWLWSWCIGRTRFHCHPATPGAGLCLVGEVVPALSWGFLAPFPRQQHCSGSHKHSAALGGFSVDARLFMGLFISCLREKYRCYYGL